MENKIYKISAPWRKELNPHSPHKITAFSSHMQIQPIFFSTSSLYIPHFYLYLFAINYGTYTIDTR